MTTTFPQGSKAYSIDQFCQAHGLSRSYFYLLLARGKGPRLMRVGKRRLISDEAAAEWRRHMEIVPLDGEST